MAYREFDTPNLSRRALLLCPNRRAHRALKSLK